MPTMPQPPAKLCLSERWVAVVVVLTAFYQAPALAQGSGRIGVSGFVAPRCWAVVPEAGRVRQNGGKWMIDGPAAVRCNYGAMPLSVIVSGPAAPAAAGAIPQAAQTAREGVAIVISPAI